jgi:hypothetical protein
MARRYNGFMVDVEDPFMDFDSLMVAAQQLPKRDLEMVYGLVEYWFNTNAHNFIAYYRNLEDKKVLTTMGNSDK